ncbi:ABC transporter ATP-binding protein [Vallitalea okinawensis]|uniref:ABC transporter ATP-binding protein n=1 Tax=Vallitalea okinawensis TaxID=2078660 RepID=UPI000CFD6732|nr:ABC transporter ATP-binding protein [Vallitalea okinawensis]
MKLFLQFIKPFKNQFIISQLFMLVAVVVSTAFPLTVKNLFDISFLEGSMEELFQYMFLLILVLIIGELAKYRKRCIEGKIGEELIADMRHMIFNKLQSIPLPYYNKRSSGDIVSTVTNDLNIIQQTIAMGLSFVIEKLLTLIIVLFLLIRLDPILTVLCLAIIPIISLMAKILGDKIQKLSKDVQRRLGTLTTILNQSLLGMDVIKAFVLEEEATGMYEEQNKKVLYKSLKRVSVKEKTAMIIGLLNIVQLAIIISVGSYRVHQQLLSPGSLIAFILYAEMLIGPIALLSGLYVEIQRALASMHRIMDILKEDNEENLNDEQTCPEIQGNLEFNHVSFSYDQKKDTLKDINIRINKGDTVALVGPSGVGKSTLLKLIPRFYQASKGKILVDGHDINKIQLAHLRDRIAIVPQETYLFGLSVRENISCGNTSATGEEIIQAAKQANAHDFIMEMENGYDTIVHEGGSSLSGGQKQRIAIARAFLKQPEIILLDEPTASLDSHSEQKVQEALSKLTIGRTTLIIAHRLATIKDASKVALLNNGRIEALGTHNELFQRSDLYRNLYKAQFSY